MLKKLLLSAILIAILSLVALYGYMNQQVYEPAST